MRNIFRDSVYELMQDNKDVMLLTADLGYGVFESIEEKFPNNYCNVGVAEQNMTGIASGLALEGRVVFTYSIGNFPTLRCLEQIRNDACYHDLNVNIVSVGGGFSYGALGMSHHATEDLGIMRSLPNVTVVAPADKWEAKMATFELAKRSGVGYLRIDKTIAENTNKENEKFKLGVARRVREGKDISLISTGGIMVEVLKAADILSEKGINCRVVSMHTVKPIDQKEIMACAADTGGIVTIEENNIIGGLGGAVAETCMENGAHPKKFKRIGLNDMYSAVVGSPSYLRNKYGLDAKAIVKAVESL